MISKGPFRIPDDPDRQLFGTEPLLEEFGLDEESWMEQVRQADRPLPSHQIGRFEIYEEVSRGGQGVVYRAFDPDSNRFVALKRLLVGAFATSNMRRRLEREVEAAASLDHPGIVQMYGLEEIDGQPILAMQWIHGLPVHRWSQQSRSSREPQQALSFFLQICDAVQHAHQRGVIHRDIKPSNILVDSDGRPHLLDFGLAKRTLMDPDESRLTRSEQFLGTPAYAAPEQLQASAAADVRADVYSLGVILFELLTGQLPYDIPTDVLAWLRTIDSVEPRRPSALRRQLGRELDVLLLKAIRKEKEMRYQSVDALSEDVRRYLKGEPITAHPPSVFYQMRKLVRRHRWPFVTLALIGLMLLSFSIGSWRYAAALKSERDRVQQASIEAERASREARQQAQRAQSTLDFLVHGILAAADPWEGPRDRSVGDVVDLAAERLEGDLGEPPLVRAAIHHALGRTYQSLGRLEDALVHLRAAGELYAADATPLRRETLGNNTVLGAVLAETGDYEESERLLRETLRELHRVEGEEAAAYRVRVSLANLLDNSSRPAEAVAMTEAAIDFHRQHFGKDPPISSDVYHVRYRATMALGDGPRAEQLVRESLERTRVELGEDSRRYANDLHVLALLLHASHPQKAVEYLEETRQRLGQRLGDDHPTTGMCRTILARAYAYVGEATKAAEEFEAGFEAMQAMGADSPYLLDAEYLRASIAFYSGRSMDTVEILRPVIARMRQLPGGYYRTYQNELLLGQALVETRAYDEAADLLYAVRAEIVADPRMHRHLTTLTNELAFLEVQRGDPEAAHELVLEDLALAKEVFRGSDPSLASAFANAGESYFQMGLSEQAAEHYGRAVELIEALAERKPKTYGAMVERYCLRLLSLGRVEEGAAVAEAHLGRVEKVLGAQHNSTVMVEAHLLNAWVRMGLQDEAEDRLLELYEDLVAREGDRGHLQSVLVDHIVGMYTFLGRQEELAEWGQR
jgi:serine/threonine protein kinase/tetratricopeptide (TPR) repeat protein